MIIDSSAVLAIAFQEPEAERFATAIAEAPERAISAVNWLEVMMVVESRNGEESADDVLLILEQLGVETLAFDADQAYEAREAWRRFGKGRHPAALNLGDCCAYAAATIKGRPLLFKGGDFEQTDVARAQWQP
jgi:ribonuclease VapC